HGLEASGRADVFKAQLDRLASVQGTLKRNSPWEGITALSIEGETRDYFIVGNRNLLFVASHAGLYVLHRE
ncbi:MAG TPA: hypothetical protein PLQ67_05070, partial [Burkholderiaceae bacterium]|nr:hypothetical protein [Burkholderiaceae bacterium]